MAVCMENMPPQSLEKQILGHVLGKNGLKGVRVIPLDGGQINFVYRVGEDHVLKVERNLSVLPHQPELLEKAQAAGAKVPRVIDCGNFEGKHYILMERVTGRKLSESWLGFTEQEREGFIAQIADQLRIFHSIRFDKYSPQRPIEFDNFEDAIKWQTSFDGIHFDAETQGQVQSLESFFRNKIVTLNETGTAVFVHNDFHLGNVLYEGDRLTGIIDFDFSRQAPKDYELWHLVDFFRWPKYYVEKSQESTWEGYRSSTELKQFKKYYPELFSKADLPTRIRLYLIDDIIGTLRDGAKAKFLEKTEDYFKSDWLERWLS